MRIATVSDKLRRALCWLVALSVMFVAACGGPGDQTTAQTSKEKLTLTIDNTTLTLSKSAVVTATVVDGNGAAVVGEQVTFSTDSKIGTMTPASGIWKTDGSGVATITLAPGANPGTGTITATTAKGTTASLNYQNTVSAGAAASIQLLVSSSSLLADGTSSVDLTAILKDSNNNTVPAGQLVQFTADSGSITVANNGLTDAAGRVTAKLSSPGDYSTRVINVKAVTGSLSTTNQVSVSGTAISISGVNTLVTGTTTPLTIRLKDGAGKPIQNQAIALASSLGNRFLSGSTAVTTATTDSSGQITVTYSADKAGSDSIVAGALNTRATSNINISNDQFILSAPAGQSGVNYPASAPIEVNLNTSVQLVLSYTSNGAPQSGRTVTFSTTRGTLSTNSAITDANGIASIRVAANTAGPATLTASTGGVSAQLPVNFVATTVKSVTLQADNTTVAPNGSTTITATLKDANFNLVKNQTVIFTLVDPTGGSLSVGQGVTDIAGQTTTTYRAGSAAGPKDAVQISATVLNQAPSNNNSPLKLTVAAQSLFVRVGTGNAITPLSTTLYQQPFSVIVTDVAGNPVAGAQVQTSALPVAYAMGQLVWNEQSRWIPVIAVTIYSRVNTPCNFGDITESTVVDNTGGVTTTTYTCKSFIPPDVCPNEDIGYTGIFPSGVDYNGNGQLDPGNVASISPATVTTDGLGTANLVITYPKDHAIWTKIQLVAKALVTGTEGVGQSTPYWLPGIDSDYVNSTTLPPGHFSPYNPANYPSVPPGSSLPVYSRPSGCTSGM